MLFIIGRMLAAIPGLQVSKDVPLSDYTRFGIGGAILINAEVGML
jgi:hypothetical protein